MAERGKRLHWNAIAEQGRKTHASLNARHDLSYSFTDIGQFLKPSKTPTVFLSDGRAQGSERKKSVNTSLHDFDPIFKTQCFLELSQESFD